MTIHFDAPFEAPLTAIKPEWIDYNGHLNMAYYLVLFDHCVDYAFDALGLGPDYARTHHSSFYTLEIHVSYLSELHLEAPVRVTLQMLDYDAKRTHYFQHMYDDRDGTLSATMECVCMHVDLATRKSSPFPPHVIERVRAMHEAHRSLGTPPQVGRVMGIPGKA
jgi:acyl-CoA thioester hydrolase